MAIGAGGAEPARLNSVNGVTHVPRAGATVRISLDRDASGPSTRLVIGVTHTQFSADSWRNPLATARARGVLRATSRLQNQSIMGWGALSPEPSPGHYDWTTLDRRIALIQRSGGTPVITLCCAPDWMKGGRSGATDWSQLEAAPDPNHFGDFAQLAAAVARRYPTVAYFQVWNELKGFYDRATNRWDAAGYTELYNRVYDAVKRVRPNARVGGPYVVLESSPAAAQGHPSDLSGPWGMIDQRGLDVITYWLAHAHGADFVSVDTRTASRDGRLTTDEFTATEKFVAINRWLSARTSLPVWWSEWYVRPPSARWSQQHDDAVMTTAIMKMAATGATAALVWQPEGGSGTCRGCLWSDTATPDGGAATRFARSLAAFTAAFPSGSKFVRVRASSGPVEVLASTGTVVLVNTARHAVEVAVDGRSLRLRRYDVRYLTRE
jgi:Glycosyl hydrolases family 39.